MAFHLRRPAGFRSLPVLLIGLAVSVVIVVASVLLAVPAINSRAVDTGVSKPSLATSLALGAPLETVTGGQHRYNFSVESAGGGLTLADLSFQVLDPSGAPRAPDGWWSLTVVGLSGYVVGTYVIASNLWTSGGATLVDSQQVISFDTGVTSLSGETLQVIGTGSFQGSISVALL
jgi:hypothetical protein